MREHGSPSSKRPTWAERPLKPVKRTRPRPERGGGQGPFTGTLGRVRGAALVRRSYFIGSPTMGPVFKLACFGLRQVFDIDAAELAGVLQQHLADHAGTLPRALAAANAQTWKAIGV